MDTIIHFIIVLLTLVQLNGGVSGFSKWSKGALWVLLGV